MSCKFVENVNFEIDQRRIDDIRCKFELVNMVNMDSLTKRDLEGVGASEVYVVFTACRSQNDYIAFVHPTTSSRQNRQHTGLLLN